MRRPDFTVRGPDGHVFETFPDGSSEGFPKDSFIINHAIYKRNAVMAILSDMELPDADIKRIEEALW